MIKTLKRQIQIAHKLTETIEQKDKLIAALQGANRRYGERVAVAEQRLADTASRLDTSRAKVLELMHKKEHILKLGDIIVICRDCLLDIGAHTDTFDGVQKIVGNCWVCGDNKRCIERTRTKK
jgi:hypothetical protein